MWAGERHLRCTFGASRLFTHVNKTSGNGAWCVQGSSTSAALLRHQGCLHIHTQRHKNDTGKGPVCAGERHLCCTFEAPRLLTHTGKSAVYRKAVSAMQRRCRSTKAVSILCTGRPSFTFLVRRPLPAAALGAA